MVHTTAPQVFVSYAWESESHRKRVKKFVQDLRKNGVNVTWDEDLLPGERLPSFMADSISTSDYVLLICTPTYKRRADGYALDDPNTYGKPNPTGVLYECKIITAEICETSNEKKFIPILFDGDWKTSLPTWAKGKKGIDLSKTKLYKDNLPMLISLFRNKKSKSSMTNNNVDDDAEGDEENGDEDGNITITAVAIDPSGLRCVSASSDDLVRLWDLDNGKTVDFMETPCRFIIALAITPDGRKCIAISREGRMQIWDMATRKTVTSCQIDDRWFMVAAISSNGRWCAAHTCRRKGPRLEKMLLWDLTSEEKPSLLDNCFYSAVALSDDGGSLIASWSSSLGTGIVDIINTISGEKVPLCWKPQGRHKFLADDQVNAIAVTPDKACIVLGTCKDVVIWKGGTEPAHILSLGEWVHSIAVSSDGTRLVCGTSNTLYTIDIYTGKCISFMEL